MSYPNLERIGIAKPAANICKIRFMEAPNLVVIKNTEGRIFRVRVATGSNDEFPIPGHPKEGCNFEFIDDGILVDGDWNGAVRVWDAKALRLVTSHSFPNCMVKRICKLPGTGRFVLHVSPKWSENRQLPSFLYLAELHGSEIEGNALYFGFDPESVALSMEGDKVCSLVRVPSKTEKGRWASECVLRIDAIAGPQKPERSIVVEDWFLGTPVWAPDSEIICLPCRHQFRFFDSSNLKQRAEVARGFATFPHNVWFHPSGEVIVLSDSKDTTLVERSALGI